MASIESKIIYYALKVLNNKNSFVKKLDTGVDNTACVDPPSKFFSEFSINKKKYNGRYVFFIKPKIDVSCKYVLYFHGGAYTTNINKIHWLFLADIIRNTKCNIILPDYPLCPEYTYKDVFNMIVPIYKEYLQKVKSENLIIVGDSAGAGLALSLCQVMKNKGIDAPSKVILISPWLDITMTDPYITSIQPHDPILNSEDLKRCGNFYSKGIDPLNYLVSPINGPIKGVGQINLFTGTKDILNSDARRLKEKAREKQIKINYFEYKDMIHDWIVIGNMPEAKNSREQIFDIIRV